MTEEEPDEGLTNGTDVVWVRNADMHRKGFIALEKMRAEGMLVAYPGPRIVGPRRMTWYPMPRWFAKDYALGPHYDEPFEEPRRG